LEQKEQVQRVTVSGRFATVNRVAPQWQLPFTVMVSLLVESRRKWGSRVGVAVSARFFRRAGEQATAKLIRDPN
jgi:hypothetical protein